MAKCTGPMNAEEREGEAGRAESESKCLMSASPDSPDPFVFHLLLQGIALTA